MSLNLNEQEFITKYGFDLHDFYYMCIYDICRKSYFCYSVKELAYEIKDNVYKTLNEENTEESILYKLTENTIYNIKIYTHNIAIPFKDIYINFEIRWEGGFLKVTDWDLNHKEEIENNKTYEDIQEAISEDEEEYI